MQNEIQEPASSLNWLILDLPGMWPIKWCVCVCLSLECAELVQEDNATV